MGITDVARYFIRDEGHYTVIKSISSTEPRDCRVLTQVVRLKNASIIPEITAIKHARKSLQYRKNVIEFNAKINFPLRSSNFVGISSKVR